MAALMKAMLLLNRQNPNLRAQSTGNSMTRLDKGQIMTWRGDGHKMNFAGFIFRLWYLSHVYPLIDKPCLWSQKKHLYEIWPVGMRTRKKRPPSIGTRISEQRVRHIWQFAITPCNHCSMEWPKTSYEPRNDGVKLGPVHTIQQNLVQ